MPWFHTVALPIATLVALAIGVKFKAPLWKQAALVVGCGLMMAGLWLHAYSIPLLVAGGVVFFLGVTRRVVTPL